MSTTNLFLSDDSLLAEYVPLEPFKGILQQRLHVAPDTLALLIKDGQIAQASAGVHLALGGILRTVKDAVAGRHALRLLIADLKPFPLTTSVSLLTRDHVPVDGELTVELQIDPEKPANVLGLMKEHGPVSKASLLDRLAPHLGERVLSAAAKLVDAVELRGNVGLQDKIQADTVREVERLAGDLGLIVRSVSLQWAFSDEERALILQRQQEREQEQLEREFKIANRALERESESTIVRLQTELNVDKVEAANEDELRRLILSNELAFADARETGERIQELKALEHELQLNRTRRLDGLKAQLEAEENAVELARTTGQRRDVEMDVALRERKHELAAIQLRAEIRTVERSIEDLDRRQTLALRRLEELQELEIAAQAREQQFASVRGIQDIELEAESRRLDLTIKGGDAEHRRKMEEARLAQDEKLSTIQMLKDASPEQILAVNAGFSPQVADVLIEQARAKATDGAERIALLREMIQQAQDARVSSEAQARHMFDSGMRGATGVAQGVGSAAAGSPTDAGAPAGDAETAECPDCHRHIPTSDRHCRYCGRQMRQ